MAEEPVPESRSYTHTACGTESVVSGDAFSVASNPIADMTRTWCTACNAHFPVSEYRWTDTGENIADYYKRHSAKATSLDRLLCSKKFLLATVAVGLLIGAAAGLVLSRNGGTGQKILVSGGLGFVGVFIAAAVNVSVIGPMVAKRVFGVADTRKLK